MARAKPRKCKHGWVTKSRNKSHGRYCRPSACKYASRRAPLRRRYKSGPKKGKTYYSYCLRKRKRGRK